MQQGLWYSTRNSDFFINKDLRKNMNHDTTNNDDVFVIFLQQSCSNNRDAFLRKNRFSKIRIMMTVSYFLRLSREGGQKKKRHD